MQPKIHQYKKIHLLQKKLIKLTRRKELRLDLLWLKHLLHFVDELNTYGLE
jgi:hypothetical protein